MEDKHVALIVPTLNAGVRWKDWLVALEEQIWKPRLVLVVDSSSSDGTAELAEAHGLNVKRILRTSFDHGGTRNAAVGWAGDVEFLIYMTQDAVLAHTETLKNIMAPFHDDDIGMVYGRQLPKPGANTIEAHARLFNYPNRSDVRDSSSIPRLGIKTAFCSNSFSAYRRSALEEVGGFPEKNIVGEDMYVAAKMLLSGWKIAYCAEATVYHSHDYDYLQEFRRYFDTGVFQSRASWIRDSFGAATGEGRRFVLSELKYLFHCAPWLIPSALVRTSFKYAGYALGKREGIMPITIKKKLSMHSGFWS